MTKINIHQLARDFLHTRKNSNNLVDIINYLENSTKQIPSILALEEVFCKILERQDLIENDQDNESEKTYKKWLNDCYEEGFNKILNLLKTSKFLVQNQALSSLMKILVAEAKYSITKDDKNHLPVPRLQSILEGILLADSNAKQLIMTYTEYIIYQDVEFYTLSIMNIFSKNKNQSMGFIKNYLLMIEKCLIKDSPNKSNENICKSENHTFAPKPEILQKTLKLISKNIIRWNYSTDLLREVLLIFVEKLIPMLDYPVFLTDFLMDAMGKGGAVGVIGLQGMFTLIQKYNLEYPKIYNKLYTMFNPDIFHSKFKSRLFYLGNLFLTSTHLPEQLVAAYVKKFARLALVAPSNDIQILLYFIGNLIIRHPGLKKMLTSKPTDPEILKDPYNYEETNPYESHALECHLWELYDLQNHYFPPVSTQATKLLKEALPKVEFDMQSLLDIPEEQMFEKQIKKRKNDNVPLTFLRPTSLHLPEGDKMMTYWKFD